MSNESSASETTPLRRPESQLSAESSANVAINNNNKHVTIVGVPPAQTALTIPSNIENNFSIEERLHSNNNNRDQQQHNKTMDTNKRILCRVGLDVLILLCGECCQLAFVTFVCPIIHIFIWI